MARFAGRKLRPVVQKAVAVNEDSRQRHAVRLIRRRQNEKRPVKMPCADAPRLVHYEGWLRIWWNWQTRYFEVVVPKGVQVQVLLCAPIFLSAELRYGIGWKSAC